MTMLTGYWKTILSMPMNLVLGCQVAWAQTLNAGQLEAASWSVDQSQHQINALEAERSMSMMLPEQPMNFFDDPKTWIIALSVLLILSLVCLTWLFLLMRRWKHQEWQSNAMVDWEEQTREPSRPMPSLDDLASSKSAAYGFHATRGKEIEQHGLPPLQALAITDDMEYQFETKLLDQAEASEGILVVEETSALQQAQFWTALNKIDTAIDILEQYYEQDRTPHCWLMLFDLYRKTHQRDKYERMKRRFKCTYNARVPAWEEKWPEQPRLKDMPELSQRINRFLSSNHIIQYLEGLLFDDRGGARRGFEFGVYCDLVKLLDSLCAGQRIANCESVCQ